MWLHSASLNLDVGLISIHYMTRERPWIFALLLLCSHLIEEGVSIGVGYTDFGGRNKPSLQALEKVGDPESWLEGREHCQTHSCHHRKGGHLGSTTQCHSTGHTESHLWACAEGWSHRDLLPISKELSACDLIILCYCHGVRKLY